MRSLPISAAAGRVLVIDDDPGFGPCLARLLQTQGFSAACFTDPAQGVARAIETVPDAVVLDACLRDPALPEPISAQEAIRRLKSNGATRRVPIFVISGIRRSAEDEAEFRMLGAAMFLTKSEAVESGVLARHLKAEISLNRRETGSSRLLSLGGALLDAERGVLRLPRAASPIQLSPAESRLLSILIEAGGAAIEEAFIHARLLHRLREGKSTAVKTAVCRLRSKLGARGGLIQCVRSLDGARRYRFDVGWAQTAAERAVTAGLRRH
jgi:DNA-binding response OmpR family regulator